MRCVRCANTSAGIYEVSLSAGPPTRHALSMVSSLAELSDMPAGLDLDQPYPQAATGKRDRAGGEKTPHLPDGWLCSDVLTDAERDLLRLAEDGANGG